MRSDAPVIDQLTIREITVFLKDTDSWKSDVSRTRFPGAALGKTLESEWGLALHIESRKGTEARRYLLDFGFTPDVYANNLELMKIDLGEVDALMRPLDPLKGLSVAPGITADCRLPNRVHGMAAGDSNRSRSCASVAYT